MDPSGGISAGTDHCVTDIGNAIAVGERTGSAVCVRRDCTTVNNCGSVGCEYCCPNTIEARTVTALTLCTGALDLRCIQGYRSAGDKNGILIGSGGVIGFTGGFRITVIGGYGCPFRYRVSSSASRLSSSRHSSFRFLTGFSIRRCSFRCAIRGSSVRFSAWRISRAFCIYIGYYQFHTGQK